jgi:hypothetical protein
MGCKKPAISKLLSFEEENRAEYSSSDSDVLLKTASRVEGFPGNMTLDVVGSGRNRAVEAERNGKIPQGKIELELS